MPPSPARIATLHLAQQEGVLWAGAMDDLRQLETTFANIERKPDDLAVLRRGIKLTDKAVGVFVWVQKVFPKGSYTPLLAAWKSVGVLVKSKSTSVPEMQVALRDFKVALQDVLDRTAPTHFTHLGFKFDNPEHIPWEACRVVFDGMEFLKAMFQKRGVSALLEQGVRRIVIVPTEGMTAHFDSRTRELTVSTSDLAKTGRFSESFAGEAVIHEFGHFVHRNFITGEAAAAWDVPWKGIPTLADPQNQHLRNDPGRAKKLDLLEIPTDYGKVDQYEDFAETFLVFMVAPDRLSPTAKFRMQRALSLSGLYGKAVMRVGHVQVERIPE